MRSSVLIRSVLASQTPPPAAHATLLPVAIFSCETRACESSISERAPAVGAGARVAAAGAAAQVLVLARAAEAAAAAGESCEQGS